MSLSILRLQGLYQMQHEMDLLLNILWLDHNYTQIQSKQRLTCSRYRCGNPKLDLHPSPIKSFPPPPTLVLSRPWCYWVLILCSFHPYFVWWWWPRDCSPLNNKANIQTQVSYEIHSSSGITLMISSQIKNSIQPGWVPDTHIDGTPSAPPVEAELTDVSFLGGIRLGSV